jgi:quercetin dioxygenase-like cupin family protein
MNVLPRRPTAKGTPDRFVGDAWFDPIAAEEEGTRLRASLVRFAPGARNAWHRHPLGQILHVTDGVGRTQARGGQVVEIRAGDTIHTPPGEWHWHGAAPDRFMTHLTVYEAPDEGPEAEWGEHVTDEEYSR